MLKIFYLCNWIPYLRQFFPIFRISAFRRWIWTKFSVDVSSLIQIFSKFYFIEYFHWIFSLIGARQDGSWLFSVLVLLLVVGRTQWTQLSQLLCYYWQLSRDVIITTFTFKFKAFMKFNILNCIFQQYRFFKNIVIKKYITI